MELNANFTRRAVVHAAKLPWKASPMAGVERRMLDRLGDEVARATTIVRYAPGSHFSPHTHTGGEEFLVLEGVFQDEHGDYPTGTYVRNPPQSSHTPGSEPGCMIFVKLWQFDPDDRVQFSKDTNALPFETDPDNSAIQTLPLYKDAREEVSLQKWQPGARVELNAENGLEILLLEGEFTEKGEEFHQQSWLRLPRGSNSTAITGKAGAKIWMKRNHLATPPSAPAT